MKATVSTALAALLVSTTLAFAQASNPADGKTTAPQSSSDKQSTSVERRPDDPALKQMMKGDHDPKTSIRRESNGN